jgi:hypothetical protein
MATDDERLMNLRGDLLQACHRGLLDGCTLVDTLSCFGAVIAEMAIAGGFEDVTPVLIAVSGAARGCFPEARRRAMRGVEGRERARSESEVYRSGVARLRGVR